MMKALIGRFGGSCTAAKFSRLYISTISVAATKARASASTRSPHFSAAARLSITPLPAMVMNAFAIRRRSVAMGRAPPLHFPGV